MNILSVQLPRLYPVLDLDTLARRGCPVEAAAAAMLAAGARILQFRHKGRYTRDVFELAEAVGASCREHGALYILDDRADIAMMLDAGLHVGQDDVPVPIARRLIGPSRMLGFSTHNAAQLAEAASLPIDYAAFGPVFPTGSKARPDPVIGLEGVALARQAVPDKVLVAIGGITRATAREVLAAGADSVAVIGDLIPESGTPEAIRERVEEWLSIVRE